MQRQAFEAVLHVNPSVLLSRCSMCVCTAGMCSLCLCTGIAENILVLQVFPEAMVCDNEKDKVINDNYK